MEDVSGNNLTYNDPNRLSGIFRKHPSYAENLREVAIDNDPKHSASLGRFVYLITPTEPDYF